MSFSKTTFPRPNGKTGPSTPRCAKTGKRDFHDSFYQAPLSSSPRFLPSISVHRKEAPVISTKPPSLSKPRTPKLQCSPLASKKDWDQNPPDAMGTSPRDPTASKIEQCKGIVQPEAPIGIDSLQNLPGILQLQHASSGVSSCEHIISQEKLSHGEGSAHLKIEGEAHSGHEGVTTEISICKEKNSSPHDLPTCQRQQSSLAGMSHLPPNATLTIQELEEYIYDLKQMLETERASNKDLRERLAETEGILAEAKTHVMSIQDLLNTEKELRAAAELRIPSTSPDTQDEQLNCPNRLTTSGELNSGNVSLSLKLNPWGYPQPRVAEIDDLRTSRAKKIELLAVPKIVREWKRNCENPNVLLWVMGTAQLITLCTLCYIKWKR